MRIGKVYTIALAATLLITASAGWLPAAMKQSREAGGHIAVFHGEPIIQLSNANIVDALAAVELQERLGHAEWRNAVLSLELLVPSGSGRPAAWFSDIEKLITLSFLQLNNVNRLLVRIMEWDEGGKRLLAAVDVRASDGWLQDERFQLPISDPVHDEGWRQRLRLSFTSAWIERFGLPAGYSAHAKREQAADIAK
ncbi:hypothetical protein [Paenibacillus sp. PL2-23]|uniref:hypothetical protein n=1 Tax=Paenibacillus sp. PL2-23 TaxID=2100729 RepID=UPI0030F81FBF